MNFTIDSIGWPNDRREAVHWYLGFLVAAIDTLEPSLRMAIQEPLRLVKGELDGTISERERVARAAEWWDFLEAHGELRSSKNREILIARLAICLLAVSESGADNLGEELSWFLEIFISLGGSAEVVLKLMPKYFLPEG